MVNRCTVLLSVAPWLLCSLALFAQEDATQEAPGDRTSKLSMHGFLSQAYVRSDGFQLLGIPEDGTADYRDMALQFRYAMSPRDTFIVQLSHTRKGRSLVQPLREDIELDWAFYQHGFDHGTYLKVGRIPMPIGIYNEIRDVGTLLPFYSPPFSVYSEDRFAAEQIDGLLVSHRFGPNSPWELGVDVYGGGWSMIEASVGYAQPARADVRDAFGMQLWLSTPVSGLRFGLGANRFDVSGGLFRVGESDRWEAEFFSIDGDFDRFLIRAELYHRELPLALAGGRGLDAKSDSYYLQLGYRLGSWAIYVQGERSELRASLANLLTFNADLWEDYALALTYAFHANIVLKVEIHDNESYFTENVIGGNFLVDPPSETTYGLTSLSVSF